MRLSLQAQQIIKNTTKEVLGIDAVVKVFGSRIDDDARGGDIDLLVELPFVIADSERKTLQLTARLQLRMGDQPIDVVVIDPSTRWQSIDTCTSQQDRNNVMISSLNLPVTRFLQTLEIVAKEGKHLTYSWNSLFEQIIDVEWVENLDQNARCAEQMEAFVSRYGRMQDTMADKLFPRWLLALAETPGSQIETLNRAERLGVLTSAERWLEMRNLRNRLVHEYITDSVKFAQDLALAKEYSLILIDTFNRLRQDVITRMGHNKESLPEALTLPEQSKDAYHGIH